MSTFPLGARPRASWNAALEKSLVDILHEHNTSYYRSQNGWSSETWNHMVKLFLAKNPYVQVTKSQIQDKEKDLKRDYRMLKDARNQSGAGWNEAEFKLEAETHLWDNSEVVSGVRCLILYCCLCMTITCLLTTFSSSFCSHLGQGSRDSRSSPSLSMNH